MAACEKRRSGLAPKTTQGPGTKTESSIFGMPNQQVRRAASLSASGRVDGAACAQEYSGGGGGWPSASLLTTYMVNGMNWLSESVF